MSVYHFTVLYSILVCSHTATVYTPVCVCWLYQLCIVFTVHLKYTLMWLPLHLQTPSGLPV